MVVLVVSILTRLQPAFPGQVFTDLFKCSKINFLKSHYLYVSYLISSDFTELAYLFYKMLKLLMDLVANF